MNIYRAKFAAVCPNNGALIEYALTLETDRFIMVEALQERLTAVTEGYHEQIADLLCEDLGGRQTLVAEHHGVQIETRRPAANPWPQ